MIGLAALLTVSVLLGGVISLLALGAVNVTGLSGSDSAPPPEPSLYIPSPSKTEEPEQPQETVAPPESPTVAPTEATTSPEKPRTKKPKPQRAITLAASPQSVSPYQRINLVGSYPGANGTTLQVQRLQGGAWASFPTSATVNNGSFSTYVETGQGGPNQFRVIDPSTGRASAPVTVNVR